MKSILSKVKGIGALIGTRDNEKVAPVGGPTLTRQNTSSPGKRTRVMMSLQTSWGESAESVTSKESARKANSQSVTALQQSMQHNMAEMRNKLADVETLQSQLRLSEVSVDVAVDDANEENQGLGRFIEEMEGDFELMKHKPR